MQADDNVTLGADGTDVLTVNADAEFTDDLEVDGNFSLDDGVTNVTGISTSVTVDLASPSDANLVTEGALADAIGDQDGSGLTYDAVNDEIDLGGDLTGAAILGTNGNNFQVADDNIGTTNYLTVADGGNITIGDGTVTTGSGEVTLGGLLDADAGVEITRHRVECWRGELHGR